MRQNSIISWLKGSTGWGTVVFLALVFLFIHNSRFHQTLGDGILISGLVLFLAWTFGLSVQKISWLRERDIWRHLFESADWAVAVGSNDRETYLTVNPALARMHGYTVEELKGKPIVSLFPPEIRHQVPNFIEQTHEKGHYIYETIHMRKDGTVFPVLVDVTAVKDGSGNILYRAGHVRDITAAKKHEEQQRFLSGMSAAISKTLDYRRALEEVARLSVPALADWSAVEILAPNGSFERVAAVHKDPAKQPILDELEKKYSPPMMRIHGLTDEILSGKPLCVSHADERQYHDLLEPGHFELVQKLAIKSYIVIPLYARGSTFGALTLISGTKNYTESDRKFAEEICNRIGVAIDNVRLYNEAKNAVLAREDMVAVVSHDLKNPLSAIQLISDMIRKILKNEGGNVDTMRIQLQGYVDRIERSSRQAFDLTDAILDVTKMQMGQFVVSKSPIQVKEIIEEVYETLNPVANEKAVYLERTVFPMECMLNCDRTRVVQALSNLVGNAIKFTPRGGKVSIAFGTSPNGEILFSVEDTGQGIPKEVIPYIFDRYWRPKENRHKGTGLGLSIVKGIMEAHGGKVIVKSQVGTGSSFALIFPGSTQMRQVRAEERFGA